MAATTACGSARPRSASGLPFNAPKVSFGSPSWPREPEDPLAWARRRMPRKRNSASTPTWFRRFRSTGKPVRRQTPPPQAAPVWSRTAIGRSPSSRVRDAKAMPLKVKLRELSVGVCKSETIALRHPVMPVGNGLGGDFHPRRIGVVMGAVGLLVGESTTSAWTNFSQFLVMYTQPPPILKASPIPVHPGSCTT